MSQVILTNDLMRKLFPKIGTSMMAAFVEKQRLLLDILANEKRAAMAFANVYAETGGFTIANLTENTNYTAARMAVVWKNRFPNGASDVERRFGTGADWRRKAFSYLYNTEKDGVTSRMGNRPGTDDGWNYIGRSVAQITGRDGYKNVGDRIGVDLLNNPAAATDTNLQPDILGAFWDWKRLNDEGDRGDIVGGRRIWNGGQNGLDVVQMQYKRMLAVLISYRAATAASNIQLPSADIDEVLKGYQAALIDFGYFEVGDADGLLGGRTYAGIKAFFKDRGIQSKSEYPSNALTDEIAHINATDPKWKRPIAPSRAYATETDIAPKVASVAPTQRAGLFQTITAWFSGGATVVGGAVKLLPDANDQVSPYWYMVQQWFPSVPTILLFAAVAAIAIATAIQLSKAKKATVEDYQTGKIN